MNKHTTESDKMEAITRVIIDEVKEKVQVKMAQVIADEIDVEKYIEEPHTIIDSCFRGRHLRRLVEHQIESYNDFIQYQVPRTISMFNPVHICSEQDLDKVSGKYRLEMFVTCENFNIYRAQIHEINGATKSMFPQEARDRNFTYAGDMTIDLNIKFIVRSGAMLESVHTFNKILPSIHIGKMPIMLKSSICILEQYKHIPHNITGECRMDSGGYFIVNGSEKTVIGQERAAENLVQCFNISKNNSKWSWSAEIKSVPDYKCISPKQLTLTIATKNNGFGNGMWLQIPRLKNPLPLFVVFRALGIISDEDICKRIVLDIGNERTEVLLRSLQGSIVESNKTLTQECAIKQIISNVMFTTHANIDKDLGATMKRNFALEVLSNDLFPHCRTSEQKIYFLGYMANCLLKCSLGWEEVSDRDSFVNKRVDLTGTLLNNLFRNYFNKMAKDMQKQTVREINTGSWRSTDDYQSIINMTNIYKIIKPTTIENGLKRALATGDFGVKQVNSNKVGVAQVLNRLTYISSLSHLRRINTPIDKNGKLIPPRKLHSTSWGFLCPAETPEGGSVGVVKNLSYMARVTIPCNSNSLYDYVEPFVTPIISLTEKEIFD